MKRSELLIFLALFFLGTAMAAASSPPKPDFSDTWEFNSEKSDLQILASEDQPTPQVTMIPLAEFYIVVEKGDPKFFKKYCQATDIKIEKNKDGKLKAGPIFSGYEASWLCGVTPYSRMVEQGPFTPIDSGWALEIMKKAGVDENILAKTQMQNAARLRLKSYDIIRLRTSDCEETFFLKIRNSLTKIASQSECWGYYQASFGLALVDIGDTPYFLSVEEGSRGTGEKSEYFDYWTFENGKRLTIHRFADFGFLRLGGSTSFTSCRISITTENLYARFIELPLTELPVRFSSGCSIDIKNNEWYCWEGRQSIQELVDLNADVSITEKQETSHLH